MIDPASFIDGENWNGGFHELAIEIGPTDDARLGRARRAEIASFRTKVKSDCTFVRKLEIS